MPMICSPNPTEQLLTFSNNFLDADVCVKILKSDCRYKLIDAKNLVVLGLSSNQKSDLLYATVRHQSGSMEIIDGIML